MTRVGAAFISLIVGATAAAGTFTNFESGHVRPLAISPGGEWLFAVNTPDARVAVYALGPSGATLAADVPVGLEPVAVAARTNAAGRPEAWVVNHLSDSISVVEVDTADPARSRVTRTLLVGDEPRDVVFAGTASGRAFVTAAHRGQNRPGDPQLTTQGVGRADVWTFDADAPGAPLSIVQLFGDTPRALAVSPDGATVYAAVFQSGNRTTTLLQRVVDAGFGLPPPPPGATPAGPDTALIVQRIGTQWVDELNRDWTASLAFSLPDLDVFRIAADANPPASVGSAVTGVGTVLFNMAVRPTTGKLFVSNTEARNAVRFEPVLRGHLTESRISVVDGTSVTSVHLNPHIDYGALLGTAAEIAQSVAFPTDMVFSADGATLYVAGLGSGAVAALDAAALESGVVTKTLIPVGDGPSGLALDAARDRLFVMNRFGHGISVVTNLSDPKKRAATGWVPLPYDPSPSTDVRGRRFLYDATTTSAHGDGACASCHVFGDFDSLAWDLGDPYGVVVPNPNPMVPGIAPRPVHPMKGPMTTQSLRGLATAGAMHWRGDRTGANLPGGDAFDEVAALNAFNPAFVSLLGGAAELGESQLAAFNDFVLGIQYPPSPLHALDGSLTAAQQAGKDFYTTVFSDGPLRTCNTCHAIPLGTSGFSANDGEPQDFKIPHLRNAYQKVGMFGLPPGPGSPGVVFGDQVRGFGFLHNGGVATVFQFLNAPRFTFTPGDPNTNRRNVEEFILSLDTGLAAIVGQQTTLDAAPDGARLALLLARADAGDCDVVVKGVVGGVARGALYTGAGTFLPDRASEAPFSTSELLATAAVAGQELTLTAVPPGHGQRAAIDRDLDGALDQDELDAGTSPSDAASLPGGAAFTLVRTTKIDLKDRSAPSDPNRRKLTFVSKTASDAASNRIVAPAPGSAGDPSLHGASLVVYDAAGSGEAVTIPLPAAGWSVAGSVTKPRWTYRPTAPTDAVSRIGLSADVLTVKGGRAGFGYSLDETHQGRVAVRLVLGTVTVLCAEAPARTSGSPASSAKFDRVDRFTGMAKTPAPTVCPQVPVAG